MVHHILVVHHIVDFGNRSGGVHDFPGEEGHHTQGSVDHGRVGGQLGHFPYGHLPAENFPTHKIQDGEFA